MGSSTREVRRPLALGLAGGAPGIGNGEMRSDEDLEDVFYKKDRCRDRLNSVTPKKGPSDRRYEDIIFAMPSTRVR